MFVIIIVAVIMCNLWQVFDVNANFNDHVFLYLIRILRTDNTQTKRTTARFVRWRNNFTMSFRLNWCVYLFIFFFFHLLLTFAGVLISLIQIFCHHFFNWICILAITKDWALSLAFESSKFEMWSSALISMKYFTLVSRNSLWFVCLIWIFSLSFRTNSLLFWFTHSFELALHNVTCQVLIHLVV